LLFDIYTYELGSILILAFLAVVATTGVSTNATWCKTT